jgi:hypothetical protein
MAVAAGAARGCSSSGSRAEMSAASCCGSTAASAIFCPNSWATDTSSGSGANASTKLSVRVIVVWIQIEKFAAAAEKKSNTRRITEIVVLQPAGLSIDESFTGGD